MPDNRIEECKFYLTELHRQSSVDSRGVTIMRQFNPARSETGCVGYTDEQLNYFDEEADYTRLVRNGKLTDGYYDTIVVTIGAGPGRWSVSLGPKSKHNKSGPLRLLSRYRYGDDVNTVASLLEALENALDAVVPLVYKEDNPKVVKIRTDSQDLIDIVAGNIKCSQKWAGDMEALDDLCLRINGRWTNLWERAGATAQLWLVNNVDVDKNS